MSYLLTGAGRGGQSKAKWLVTRHQKSVALSLMALKAQPLRFHPFYLLVECAHLNVTAIGLGLGCIVGTYFVERLF